MTNHYHLAIFDLDGTILDTSEGIINAIRYVLSLKGLEQLLTSDTKQFIGPPIEYIFREILKLSEQDVKECSHLFREAYKTKFLYGAKPYKNIERVLQDLAKNGIVCAVATNKRLTYTLDLLEHFDLTKYFFAIHGSDPDGNLTKADLITCCVRDLGKSDASSVMIGDTKHDADGARKALVDFLAVTYGFGFKSQDELDTITKIGVCNTPDEIATILINKK